MKKWKMCLTNGKEIEVHAEENELLNAESDFVSAKLLSGTLTEDILIRREFIERYEEASADKESLIELSWNELVINLKNISK